LPEILVVLLVRADGGIGVDDLDSEQLRLERIDRLWSRRRIGPLLDGDDPDELRLEGPEREGLGVQVRLLGLARVDADGACRVVAGREASAARVLEPDLAGRERRGLALDAVDVLRERREPVALGEVEEAAADSGRHQHREVRVHDRRDAEDRPQRAGLPPRAGGNLGVFQDLKEPLQDLVGGQRPDEILDGVHDSRTPSESAVTFIVRRSSLTPTTISMSYAPALSLGAMVALQDATLSSFRKSASMSRANSSGRTTPERRLEMPTPLSGSSGLEPGSSMSR